MYVNLNNIGCVVDSTLASRVEDLGLEQLRSCLAEYCKTGICCFSAKQVSIGVSVNLSRIGDVIVSTLTSSVVDIGSSPCMSSHNKYYKTCICCFSAKRAERGIKNKEHRVLSSESR